MSKNNSKTAKIAEAFDLPLDALCDVPKIEIIGISEIIIENFRGILDYDNNCFKINTRVGIVKIDGSDLVISSITDESVRVKGRIIKIEFI